MSKAPLSHAAGLEKEMTGSGRANGITELVFLVVAHETQNRAERRLA